MDKGWKNVAMLEKLLDQLGPGVGAQDKIVCTMIHGNVPAQHVVDAICHGVPGKLMNDEKRLVVAACFSTKKFDRGVTRLLVEMLCANPAKLTAVLEMYLFAHVLHAANGAVINIAYPTVFNVYTHLMRMFDSDIVRYRAVADAVRAIIRGQGAWTSTVLLYHGIDPLIDHPAIAHIRPGVCHAFGEIVERFGGRSVGQIVMASRDSAVFGHPIFDVRLWGGSAMLEIGGYDRE